MNEGLQALTERERETLRLLLRGHDAKSIARELGLSVHTINERLRDARRKLEVSSSREAARVLGEAEQRTPNLLGDKGLGVAEMADGMARKRRGAGSSLAWLAGGMLIMSLVIAAVVLSFALQGGSAAEPPPAQTPPVVSPSESASDAARSAREWVALVDGQQWTNSWAGAAGMFKAQVTAAQWEASVKPVRQPLGAAKSRAFQSFTKTRSLPGAPAGDYEIIQFKTNFERKSNAVETVVMAREGSDWKVAGYFIR